MPPGHAESKQVRLDAASKEELVLAAVKQLFQAIHCISLDSLQESMFTS